MILLRAPRARQRRPGRGSADLPSKTGLSSVRVYTVQMRERGERKRSEWEGDEEDAAGRFEDSLDKCGGKRGKDGDTWLVQC